MIIPFNMLHIQYSQPMRFFRLPARKSLNIAQTLGWGEKFTNPYTGRYWDWREMNRFIAFLSTDVVLAYSNRFFAGIGVGTGVQHYPTQRINSMFLIGVKWFGGFKINDNWHLELFLQHFSNARTERPNLSYNFWGLGLGRTF
ncbi:MAG: acyloxyacyl hydrolase [Bacteroidales bacterium]|nr:acyloxyacyl hydrolase [Bacteroidales bacterium]